jgi:transposase
MPRIRYATRITESLVELEALERQQRGTPTVPRVQMLRLLKSGRATSRGACAALLGYSPSQLDRWWAAYQVGGVAGLLATKPRRGKPSKLTEDAWAGLSDAMARGEIGTLKAAQAYLAEHDQIAYSLNGSWWQLRRRRAKLKTGRRRHRKSDPAQQQAYKRRLWHAPGRAGRRAGVGL